MTKAVGVVTKSVFLGRWSDSDSNRTDIPLKLENEPQGSTSESIDLWTRKLLELLQLLTRKTIYLRIVAKSGKNFRHEEQGFVSFPAGSG